VHRLGFTQCMIPARRARELKPLPGLELLPVQNIAQALRLLVREK
jgi:DNA repair protein RadA/Sms